MKVKSLTEVGSHYEIIDVEVQFLPGLPQIHFLGRADTHLKESALRIRSAFQSADLAFPLQQKIVVNLTPAHLKKVSSAVELAVAYLILCMTQQIEVEDTEQKIIFGELGLEGDVRFPIAQKLIPALNSKNLLSGPGLEKQTSGWQCRHLKDIATPQWVEVQSKQNIIKPKSHSAYLTPEQARVLKILSVGNHHAVIAGAQGTGKTWLVETLIRLLPPPTPDTLKFHHVLFEKELNWIPVARPHHSTPAISMIGGGVPPRPGEITRAHGGLLFLDEMFEFKPTALEGLREALSSQSVNVSRGLQSKHFPADFQLVGTTNLCPCGKWIPGKTKTCSYNQQRCNSILQKLSGPLMDRMHGIFYFGEKHGTRSVSFEELEQQVLQAREFKVQNARNELSSKEKALWEDFSNTMGLNSARRSHAVLAWARTLADCDKSPEIQARHLKTAYEDCVLNLNRLISR